MRRKRRSSPGITTTSPDHRVDVYNMPIGHEVFTRPDLEKLLKDPLPGILKKGALVNLAKKFMYTPQKIKKKDLIKILGKEQANEIIETYKKPIKRSKKDVGYEKLCKLAEYLFLKNHYDIRGQPQPIYEQKITPWPRTNIKNYLCGFSLDVFLSKGGIMDGKLILFNKSADKLNEDPRKLIISPIISNMIYVVDTDMTITEMHVLFPKDVKYTESHNLRTAKIYLKKELE